MGLFSKIITIFISIGVGWISYVIYRHLQPPVPPAPLPETRWGPGEVTDDVSIRPFEIHVDDKVLQDLRHRLDIIPKFNEPLEDANFMYGFNTKTLSEIVDFWKTKYNWRAREQLLNKYPHYKTNIQGLDIHFIHVKPKATKGLRVLPLLLLHGWPGSVRADVWGRKFFLLITVFFTCAPIPLMTINTWWFFAMISISGVFAVTFSVVFAYVADVTEEHERSLAYGLVSATFAASMVISPALGAYLMDAWSESLVVALATAVAILDVFFILVAVPESLPEKVRPSSWGAPISWEQADPFAALRKVGKDPTILMLCITVFLSYLPEAGQYSCIFVYLKLVMGFSVVMVAVFIATVGVLSVGAQVILGILMRTLGCKHTIMVGLLFEMLQLMWYGFGSQTWMMWAAGVLASISSISYPAISAFVSMHSDADRQGVVQGMVTGMRGLCNGLGPAMFGLIFYLFHVDLNEEHTRGPNVTSVHSDSYTQLVPGPPFVFGALLVICALLVAAFIPEGNNIGTGLDVASSLSMDTHYEIEHGHKVAGTLSPLMTGHNSDTAVL